MFKSRIYIIMVLVSLIAILFVFGYGLTEDKNAVLKSWLPYSETDNNQLTNYKIEIKYDDYLNLILGNMQIVIPNKSVEALDELYFHLYPNVFKNWKWEAKNKPKTEGYIDIKRVLVNNIEVVPHQKDTLLKINLPVQLKPKEAANVQISFDLKLPTNGLRLSKIDDTIFLAQWYPMLAVHDDEGWHLDSYTTTGDPFFSETANYEIYLDLPKGYYAVSTAEDPNQNITYPQRLYLSQDKVRDFAIMISKDYQRLQTKTNSDIKINLYYLQTQQELATLLLGGAVDAMDYYEASFGDYPMKEIDIVLTDNSGNGIAGMEYPGLVTSDATTYYNERIIPAYNVVAHELAHQWWYSTVGNNQIKEPWLDEGLTSFSEYLYMEQILNKPNIDLTMKKMKEYTDKLARENNVSVLQSIYTYGELYGPLIYGRPAAMMWDLKDRYGYEKIKEIMQVYYERYKYKVADTGDFVEVVNEVIGDDLSDFFNNWFLVE